ncbi:leucyl aminopeptidase [Rickettsiales bacterium LUAb2]
MKIEIQKLDYLTKASTILIPVAEDGLGDINIKGLKEAAEMQEFTGKKDQILVLKSLANYKKVVLIGLGKVSEIKDFDLMKIGGVFFDNANCCANPSLWLGGVNDASLINKFVLNLVAGFQLKAWDFTKYFSGTDKKTNKVEVLNLIMDDKHDINDSLLHAKAIVEGVYLTRNLVTEPANELYSDTFADAISELMKLGLEVEILDEEELKSIGMRSLLSVNQASSHEAKVAVIKWNGGGDEKPIAFVGKGVTFDSGGLSIKPGAGMMEMKRDMSGAASVVGAMATLAMRRAKVNAVGVVGLVENVISSKATRPGDVVKSLSGKTIEILNTDAEGRLVLADILFYTQDKFKPQAMINIATLTGAIIIALGRNRAGLFTNSTDLAAELMDAGNISGEKLWELPVTDEYRYYMDSDIADIANISTNMPGAAGSVTAAIFLKEFINGCTKWAHLDIAGTAWLSSPNALGKKGATGFGVRLLDTLVSKYYENK